MRLHPASIASVFLSLAALTQPLAAQDLRITKVADRTHVRIGQTITFTITVTNLGPGTATGIVFGDSLPDPLNLVSFTCLQGTQVGQSFCSVTSLAPGASATAILVATPMTNPAQRTPVHEHRVHLGVRDGRPEQQQQHRLAAPAHRRTDLIARPGTQSRRRPAREVARRAWTFEPQSVSDGRR
ncbi:MAG TPA: DUF11 domain-containing protein [Planctomycetota bacterium]